MAVAIYNVTFRFGSRALTNASTGFEAQRGSGISTVPFKSFKFTNPGGKSTDP
jgi:hypothetical protein